MRSIWKKSLFLRKLLGTWRRCSSGAGAIFLLATVPIVSAQDLRVALVDGAVEISGAPTASLDALARRGSSFEEWASVLKVSVSPDGSPILGEYLVAGSIVRFEPMFAFDPGRDYFVRFVLDGETVNETVALPDIDRRPSTRVDAIYPSSGVWPENQLKLYVHFSAPMAGGDGLEFIRLLDDAGDIVIDPFLPLGDAFWNQERTRYTVFFDPGRVKQGILPNEQMGRPIREGRHYRLVVDASWRDENGVPLMTAHEKSFTVGAPDEQPVDPESWTLRAPAAGSLQPLVVDFHEPLDHAILSRALTVAGVSGNAEISRDETRWSFTPDEPWATGTYHLVALTYLEDLAGNQIGKPFEVDVFDRIDTEDVLAETVRLRFQVRHSPR